MSSSFHLCCLGFNEYIHAQRPSKSPSSTKLRYTLRFSEYKKKQINIQIQDIIGYYRIILYHIRLGTPHGFSHGFPMAFLWPSTGFRSLRGTGDGHLPEGVPEEPAAVVKKKQTNMIIHSYIYSHFWSLIMGYDGILTKFCILISLES